MTTSWNFGTKNATTFTHQSKSASVTGKMLREDGVFALLREMGDALLLESSGSTNTVWTNQTKN